MSNLVSVIMPVYKVEKYVGEAIRSVLGQSYGNFELLVVDDGSPDRSGEIIDSFGDPRIRTIRLARNVGVATARNMAIAAAQGDFLALMDSDDVMNPFRLEQQLAFMKQRPEIALCGGWIEVFGPNKNSRRRICSVHIDPRALNASLVFGNVFCTSTIMMRREAVPDAGFRQRYAEDYDFLVRVAEKHRLAMVNDVLVRYRIRPDSAMNTYALETKYRDVWESQAPLFRALQIEPSAPEKELHLFARGGDGDIDSNRLSAIYRWYRKLIRANQRAKAYPEDEFQLAAAYVWFERLALAQCGRDALKMYFGFPLSSAHPQPLSRKARFFAKAAIRSFARRPM